MSDAPDRLWLTWFEKDQFGGHIGSGRVSDTDHGKEYPEYIRADLAAERERELLECLKDMDAFCETGFEGGEEINYAESSVMQRVLKVLATHESHDARDSGQRN